MFSFNNPYGACPTCGGLGTRLELDPDLVVPDAAEVAGQGRSRPGSGASRSYFRQTLAVLARKRRFSLDTPWKDLSKATRELILRGTGRTAAGTVCSAVSSGGTRRSTSEDTRLEIERFMSERPCPGCGGGRLRPESLAVRVGGSAIHQVCALTIKEAGAFFDALALGEREQAIARRVLKEIRERLGFLQNVGLEYLTLDRAAGTLSGGEGQRIRLATQIGSSLVGVLYILDEPSIGLHQRDNRRLPRHALRLRDLGNTVLVVEHDEETIQAADHVIDLGPGRGELGGYVVATGTPGEIMADPKSLTGRYLARELSIPVPATRRPGTGKTLTIHGAREHNLKGMPVRIPLGTFTCVTGRVRLREVHARQRHPLPGAGAGLPPGAGAAGRARPPRGDAAPRQGHQHRPVADRSHPALEPGDVHRRLHVHPGAVRADSRTPGRAATRRGASRSTSRAAGARRARATGW